MTSTLGIRDHLLPISLRVPSTRPSCLPSPSLIGTCFTGGQPAPPSNLVAQRCKSNIRLCDADVVGHVPLILLVPQ